MFKKINFLKDEIKISNAVFAKAVNSNSEFGIGADGTIDYEFKNDKAYIFKGKVNRITKNEPLGKGYKINSNFVTVSILVEQNWNNLLELNRDNALYEDSASDGIDQFQDKILENIGWHGIEFNISYRNLVEFLEKSVNGTIISIEQDNPYLFNGLGFIDSENIIKARELLFEFVKSEIISFISKNEEEIKKYGFSEEQKESMKFFGIDL